MSEERYFLDQDDDCHWYLVRASKRKEWEEWVDLDGEDERSWSCPDFATRLGGSPAVLTFERPSHLDGDAPDE